MPLSIMDEQDARKFAKEHLELVTQLIPPSAEKVHDEDNLFGEAFTIAMFVAFCKSVAELLGGAVAIAKIIDITVKLINWLREHSSGKADQTNNDLALTERLLILTFDAFVNRKAGVKSQEVSKALEADEEVVRAALEQLKAKGIIRQARDGSWKYVRP